MPRRRATATRKAPSREATRQQWAGRPPSARPPRRPRPRRARSARARTGTAGGAGGGRAASLLANPPRLRRGSGQRVPRLPRSPVGAGSPRATASRPASTSAVPCARNAARTGNARLFVARVKAMSWTRASRPPFDNQSRRPAAKRAIAAASRAERSIGHPPAGAGGCSSRLVGGTSSTTRCALVPPNPKALTAARRRSPAGLFGQSSNRPGAKNGVPGSETRPSPPACGGLGGSFAASSASRTFSNPAMPAAGRACPMFAFTDPIAQVAEPPSPLPATRNASASADNSIGSPSRVPVPWASTRPMDAGAIAFCR